MCARIPYFSYCLIWEGVLSLQKPSRFWTPIRTFLQPESFGPAAAYYRRIQDPSSDGFAELILHFLIVAAVTLKNLLQGSVLMAGRLNSHDQFRGWRLDIDNMTYEQLLDLGERIGFANTGLKDDEIGCNIRNTKFQFSDDASKHQVDKKCTICQEEYEADDELGKLNCKHSYHFQCIKQWVGQKNFCPVCKQQVVDRQLVSQS
ncbi:hypothetical protein TanjilG_21943 [Lupinus angustifolius]|uniref:RING-type E3 ubiquitin transferase n=1 Tax=Lupinus angustifolius TaxID=3871 RepID=A0A1J7HUK7_LUPAN|nr:hypothetical protein TanjilG_21943 [Lupinus angustifolius]